MTASRTNQRELGRVLPEDPVDVIDEETGAGQPAPGLELHHAVELGIVGLVLRPRTHGLHRHVAQSVLAGGERILVGHRTGAPVGQLGPRVGLADAAGIGVGKQDVVGQRAHENIVVADALRRNGFERALLRLAATHFSRRFQRVEILELRLGVFQMQGDLLVTLFEQAIAQLQHSGHTQDQHAAQRNQDDHQDAGLKFHTSFPRKMRAIERSSLDRASSH